MLLNSKLVNLKVITLNLQEYPLNLFQNKSRRAYDKAPSYIRGFTEYDQDLSCYNGKAKVRLNHLLHFYITSHSEYELAKYLEGLKEEFIEFDYYSWMDGSKNCHSFRKSSNITKRFQITKEILLQRKSF